MKKKIALLCLSLFWYASISAQVFELPNIDFFAPTVNAHNDTIDFWVSGLRSPVDKSAEDVLRRIPGIDIAEDGTIYYGGKPISHFPFDSV